MSPSKEEKSDLSTLSEHLSSVRFTEARVSQVSSSAHFETVMAVVHSSSSSKDDDNVGNEPFSADSISISRALLMARQAVKEPSATTTTSTSITLSRSSLMASCTSCASPSPSPSAKCNLQVNPNSCYSSSFSSSPQSVHSQHDHEKAHPNLATVGVTCPSQHLKEYSLPSRRTARCHRPVLYQRQNCCSLPLLISILITFCATSKCPHCFSFLFFFLPFISFIFLLNGLS